MLRVVDAPCTEGYAESRPCYDAYTVVLPHAFQSVTSVWVHTHEPIIRCISCQAICCMACQTQLGQTHLGSQWR